MKAANKLTDEEKDRQVEVEIQTAKQIASKLFQIITNKDFVKEVPDPQTRHQVVSMQLKKMDESTGQKMFESFGSAYPIVLKYMTQQLSYNPIAFEKFLRKQAQDPGKGMEGFIDHQANYVKLLYIEMCRATGKRPNLKEANRRKNDEYQVLHKVQKEIEVSKKKAENEFEEENIHHLDEKRKELLDFINQELDDGMDLEDSSDAEELESVPKKQTDEEYFNSLTRKEQNAKLDTLYFLERTYIGELDAKDKQIHEYKKLCDKEKAKKTEDWLDGTILKKKKKKSKSKKRK